MAARRFSQWVLWFQLAKAWLICANPDAPVPPLKRWSRRGSSNARRRDVGVVEGARLESDAGQQRQAARTHFIAHVFNDLTAQNDRSVCVRKPRCESRF